MKKNYLLDTNVLLHDPNAIHHFQDNHVVIPLKVIEEIDQFKKDPSELGRNARQVARQLDDLRARGRLAEGVELENQGTLRVSYPSDADPLYGGKARADDQILALARELSELEPTHPCIVVTKDINLRLRADALDLSAEDYETDRVELSEVFTGHSDMYLERDRIETFKENKILPTDADLSPNQYVLLRDDGDENQSFLARYDAAERALVPLIRTPEDLHPITPRNKEQHYAMDALLNDQIKVVTVIGKAGTGKTLLAVAAGLYKTLDRKVYRRMLVCRPTIPMGKDIGYLPGTVDEKLNPWMQPIYDALDLLANGGRSGLKRTKEGFEETERLAVEPLTYIRGRSIANQFIIVDEAQNLTPLESKTILTRVGHGTKIVLTGDIYQIDNPYVDSMSNGLSTVVDKFRAHGIAAHVVLSKGVRSEVAEIAANVL